MLAPIDLIYFSAPAPDKLLWRPLKENLDRAISKSNSRGRCRLLQGHFISNSIFFISLDDLYQ